MSVWLASRFRHGSCLEVRELGRTRTEARPSLRSSVTRIAVVYCSATGNVHALSRAASLCPLPQECSASAYCRQQASEAEESGERRSKEAKGRPS
jgi:hypothetical protein